MWHAFILWIWISNQIYIISKGQSRILKYFNIFLYWIYGSIRSQLMGEGWEYAKKNTKSVMHTTTQCTT